MVRHVLCPQRNMDLYATYEKDIKSAPAMVRQPSDLEDSDVEATS